MLVIPDGLGGGEGPTEQLQREVRGDRSQRF